MTNKNPTGNMTSKSPAFTMTNKNPTGNMTSNSPAFTMTNTPFPVILSGTVPLPCHSERNRVQPKNPRTPIR